MRSVFDKSVPGRACSLLDQELKNRTQYDLFTSKKLVLWDRSEAIGPAVFLMFFRLAVEGCGCAARPVRNKLPEVVSFHEYQDFLTGLESGFVKRKNG